MMASAFADFSALGLTYTEEIASLYLEQREDRFDVAPVDKERKEKNDVCSCRVQDIIILAEFSEIKGPIPLMTIPFGVKHDMDVDIDDFILKIMSVDYQANSSGIFKFTSDTQVLQTDVVEGVHAYVHYFSLNDIVARGFVRPLCLAYISKSRYKLEENVLVLRDKFLKVSSFMRCENRNLFLESVSLSLQYLKDIQRRYIQWKQMLDDDMTGESEEDRFMLGINLDQLIEQQTEFSFILQSAKLIKESEELSEALSHWKSVFSISDEDEIEQYISFVKRSIGFSTPVLLCQKALANEKNHSQLKPIAAISPFGIAIGLWTLCRVRTQFHKCALELMGGCFWNQSDLGLYITPSKTRVPLLSKEEVYNAMEDSSYLQLLLQLLPSNNTPLFAVSHPDQSLSNLEHIETNVFTSGNEASSSYYSALESVNEVATERVANSPAQSGKTSHSSGSSDSVSELGAKQEDISRNHPVIADDWSSDSSDCVEHNESEAVEFPTSEIWCKCIWNGTIENPQSYPGQKILYFFQMFSRVAQHILYSFLIGRTVVIAGSNTICHKVLKIIAAIVYFVPVHKDSKYLRWHKGILVSAHIERYKVIGLCVPERLTVHDMISPRDKNCVTILDVNAKQIFGPAYSGTLLSPLEENFHLNFLSDEALILFIESTFMKIREKVFLYQTIMLSGTSRPSFKPHMKTTSLDVLHSVGVNGCDADIVKYLSKLVDVRSYF